VIASGHLQTDDANQARALGVRHFVEKPFSLGALAETVYEALRPS
jgi:DNA-binding NtrC family response regulator